LKEDSYHYWVAFNMVSLLFLEHEEYLDSVIIVTMPTYTLINLQIDWVVALQNKKQVDLKLFQSNSYYVSHQKC